jgi:hypothetical protein
MAAFAAATRVGIEKLRALAALQVPPVTRSIPKIMASLLIDRIALGLTASLALVALLVFGHANATGLVTLVAVVLAWAGVQRYLTSRRVAWFGAKLDNDAMLAERAARLAHLFPAAFVVMGHTHTPAKTIINDGEATYINVGSWAEEEGDAGEPSNEAYRAARTHLTIHQGDRGPVAELLAWDGELPRRFNPA